MVITTNKVMQYFKSYDNNNIVTGNVKRCLPSGALVHTKKGLKKIVDVNIGDKVLTSSGYRVVKRKYLNGKQHISTIYTGCGEFKCTPNHRMAIIDKIMGYKWVETQDLKEGDTLITSRKPIEGINTYLPKNEFNLCDNSIIGLTPDIAWFIGLFNEAGNYNTDYISDNTFLCDMTSFNITLYGDETIDTIKNIVKIFDNNAKCTVKRLYGENIFTIVCKTEHLSFYFNKNFKNSDNYYCIPDFIKEGTVDIRNAYIAGIIDGNINNYENGFVITKSNKKRVDELQALCYSCGFETTNECVNRNCFNMSNVLKITTYFTATVVNNINQLHMTINLDDIYVGKNSYDVDMVKYFIEDEYSNDSNNPNDLVNIIDINRKSINNIFNKLNIDNVKRININDFDKHVLTLNYCPDVVSKVVHDISIVEETYDIEVEDKHEFYCNGFLTHNSI